MNSNYLVLALDRDDPLYDSHEWKPKDEKGETDESDRCSEQSKEIR